jgi:hypothetical protein
MQHHNGGWFIMSRIADSSAQVKRHRRLSSVAHSVAFAIGLGVALHGTGSYASAQETRQQRQLRPETQLAVAFVNASQTDVVIRVRPAVDGACSQEHAAVVERSIAPGARWRMATTRPLCWTREESDARAAWTLVTPQREGGRTITLD